MNVRFDEKGLVPAIIQDAGTKEVLTLAYMNEESLAKTIETGETWFYSRSRQELWHKGATSGNTQTVVSINYDCDQDALLVLVYPKGPACHTGAVSCFSERIEENTSNLSDYQILQSLEKVIVEREQQRPEGAYTTYLFEKGVDKILKKVGEEAAEVIIAAKNRDHEELRWEAADLLYHLQVLLVEQELPFKEVLRTLEERHKDRS
ncbi:bifunctional phosphoribosyl-AMP cyclohydrolase/phosphoribosyl-ATP diphosphatase HisIE [Neobacillus sp. MM2021_6]|uniref:bifunctional phosphoribosyl-AMP cyclohydrolase/phosphoribosyl-ATP diphosphatase HisIE n=1 Tax=Bacillaceae TaxID=186817 RepID=UPI0014097842|nr:MULTISPECIES: bifunctional phosphoribosyl-AMP cyclohydrolase/phosphoribosyl-ATP diphosphatase HisIE [Bacillaceae]MBO0959031.1 bifunctional phosphoribosyl-AMP cyclohydrolase/phosphoribosyl-ATP diphosphatase HisIE [Neobacillus sp. MM2021_6]NHC17761.1 bifunctional phosphoribosyl-AMP cyclohydrolase/phosphoribosyl-ATP diphosphatase HisIE [Bacillus sp. MM2020_4]WML41141.1 bifunctional phosphoribosyl-AMP cyclohydrolase/phosphoribosyl-ATP diphosphatase HisIE [Neobacillus sp. OS1-2]